MTSPKEHGFLFKAAMIMAILDRTKTQTRRAITAHNSLIDGTGKGIRDHWPHLDWSKARPQRGPDARWDVPCKRCGLHQVDPRVRVGHSIYARETWAPHPLDNCVPPDRILFKADGANHNILGRGPKNLDYPDWSPDKWRSPLHMRRYFARIVLPVIQVRAERVGDISEADAIAEGTRTDMEEIEEHDWSLCPKCGGTLLYDDCGPCFGVIFDNDCYECDTYKKRFKHLWQSINGDRPGMAWADNPPLWAYQWEPMG